MKDRSKKLLVINTDRRKATSSSSENGGSVIYGGVGGMSIGGGAEYLLKAIWDKVWEIKTDSQGNEYIFGKLPVVTQYGITMYSDGGELDLPSIYAGIPFDNRTIWLNPETGLVEVLGGTGGGSGEGVSSFWDLSNIPSWITATKPEYSYSEIEGTPDLSVYVTSTALSNALADYVKSSVLTSELTKYVTLGGDEPISGLKDFTKGLKISGLGISKSQDDVIYIDANLVVRGGITMYAEGSVDIPSILDSLPVASTTAKGIASFDSSYFSVDSDGKVTLLAENVGLNEAELASYLSNNGYATQTWVNNKGYALSADLDALQTKVNDFLEGSDTDTIINKWLELEAFLSGLNESDNLATILSDKANKATTLAGYGITDAYTKSAVDTLLGNYVTLSTTQTITGEKNFTGGLKVNGSPIVYDATNKYWKLEGDLLVTGGVTMYANEGTYTPSTIMDALLLDSATLGINDEGQLYVKGGTGGGVADSVAWENVTGKPSFAAVATSGKYSDLSGKPTLLSSFTDDVVAGKYLPLSGGELKSSKVPLNINRDANNVSTIGYRVQGVTVGILGFDQSGNLTVRPKVQTNSTYYNVWHEGNLTPSNYQPLITSTSKLAYSLISGTPTLATVATSGKYSDLSGKPTLLSSFTNDAGYLTSHQTIYNLTLQAGSFSAKTFDPNGAAMTVNIPTTTSHIREGSNLYFTNARAVSALSSTLAGYLPLSGGTMSGPLTFPANQYYADGNFSMNLENSDIVGVNAIFFNDECNTAGEGLRFPRSNGNYDTLRVENGVLKLTKDVSLSEQSSVTSYDEVWHSGNFNPKKLLSWYGDSVDGDNTSRPTSANSSYIDKSLRYYLATSSMTTGKPMSDGKILHFAWDNAGWNSQLFIPNATPNQMQYRTVVEGKPTVWSEWYTLIDSKGGTLNGALNFTVTGGGRILTLANGEYFDSYGNIHLPSDTNSWMVSGTNSNQRVVLRPMPGTNYIESMILMSNSTAQRDTMITAIRNDTGYACAFGVGLGGTNRGVYDFHLSKWMLYADETKVNLTSDIWINQDAWDNGLMLNRTAANSGCGISVYSNGTKLGIFGINGSQTLVFSIFANNVNNKKFTVDKNGNGLFYGGITMYSDIRKKTKLQDVELSLKQIAEAPLIEHYYNSDAMRTTHVGSIAQYWAGLNDWFCKLDSEGFYTMEIQNAALASAISIARELVKYESKTDRKIRLLKQRVKELEDKIEQLEKN